MDRNLINDTSQLKKSNFKTILNLSLDNNQIEVISRDLFWRLPINGSLDLSFNNLQSIPDGAFLGSSSLSRLYLSFNKIAYIGRYTFAGLKSLHLLALIKNRIKFIPDYVFAEIPLQSLWPEGYIDGKLRITLVMRRKHDRPRG